MGLTIYSEILVRRRVLVGDVLRDNFIGDIAGATAEVSSRPQVPTPELFLQVRKLGQQVMRSPAFQPLHQAADRCLRRDRNQQMNVVLRDVPFQYRDIVLPTDVPDQIPHPHCYISRQCRSPVFRDPHEVKMDIEYSVRAPPIFRHPRSLSGAHALKAVA